MMTESKKSIYRGNNRLAWVTGAGAGIGRSVSSALAKNGWRVAASARSLQDLNSLREANQPELILPIPLDVTDCIATDVAVKNIEGDIGEIELVILNAGTFKTTPLSDFSVDEMKEIFEVNVFGVARCISSVLATSKRLKTLAVVGSLAGYRGLPKASSYSASKAALINFVEAIRPEAVKRGINLSMINPGFVNTRLTPSYIPPILGISPDRAARYILDGLEREQMEITFPKSLSYLIRSTRHFPDDLYYKISRRFV